MAHVTARSAYSRLVDRLNQFPQGAPPSDLLYRILGLLFTEREAELVAQLPIRPFTAARAASAWKLPLAEAQGILDVLASRAILLDLRQGDEQLYVLPPPMAGFFEFAMMRVRGDLDQKALSELFYQYLNVEDAFVRDLFATGETQLGRVFVDETALPATPSLEVMDYERATEVVATASHRAVGLCYCRHKMQHLDRACAAPMEICLTFNGPAESLARHGNARAIDQAEAMDLLQMARERRLVQFGENVRDRVGFICNCCGCCCEAMIAARRFGFLHPVHTTSWIAEVDDAQCNGCGKCVEACPVEAMAMVSANDPRHPKLKRAKLDDDLCLGCGVCVHTCVKGGLHLSPRAERVIPPETSAHRVVTMAIERGKLQHLLFDDRALTSHRAMAAILAVILRLPPVKQRLANRQLRSRYVETLLAAAKRKRGRVPAAPAAPPPAPGTLH